MSLLLRSSVCIAALMLASCQPAAQAPSAVSTPITPAAQPIAKTKPDTPTLVVPTFDGKTFDLSRHRGHWVVVNFWATWCNPCLQEIPDLNAFDKSRDDVDVVGLAYEEIEPAEMQNFLREHPISYPIAIVDVTNPPADFETPPGLPMTYLIAPDGKVAKQFLGPITSRDLLKVMIAHDQAKSAAPT